MFPTHVKEVCKIGQGHDTCRYLMMGTTWQCAKLDQSMKWHLDSRGDTMNARGDNCPGVEEIPQEVGE